MRKHMLETSSRSDSKDNKQVWPNIKPHVQLAVTFVDGHCGLQHKSYAIRG